MATRAWDFNPYQAPEAVPESPTRPKRDARSMLVEVAVALWIICVYIWVSLTVVRASQRSEGVSIAEFASSDLLIKGLALGLPAALTIGLVRWGLRPRMARRWTLLHPTARPRRPRGAKET